MGKAVTFYLGPASGLASRRLVVRRFRRAGEDSEPAALYDQTLPGSTEVVEVNLPDGLMCQAILVDTRTSGEVSRSDVLNFHTGELFFPGPSSGDRLRILSMEDLSSSSSSSNSSSSSSSSS